MDCDFTTEVDAIVPPGKSVMYTNSNTHKKAKYFRRYLSSVTDLCDRSRQETPCSQRWNHNVEQWLCLLAVVGCQWALPTVEKICIWFWQQCAGYVYVNKTWKSVLKSVYFRIINHTPPRTMINIFLVLFASQHCSWVFYYLLPSEISVTKSTSKKINWSSKLKITNHKVVWTKSLRDEQGFVSSSSIKRESIFYFHYSYIMDILAKKFHVICSISAYRWCFVKAIYVKSNKGWST